MHESAIVWRRCDVPGHEALRLRGDGRLNRLDGTAVFTHGDLPVRLEYQVVCNADWETASALVTGWVGRDLVRVEIAVESRQWTVNGDVHPEVAGCTDLDLNFSPSTNTLPIRRLNLGIGQRALVSAAWLRFPSFELQRLDQAYERTGELAYRYESGTFAADLAVDRRGIVTRYPGIWELESLA